MQNHIQKKGKLLDEEGVLNQRGYSTQMLLEYSRKDIIGKKLRIKEWDYYLIYNDKFAVALTVADNSYMGLISASFIDFTMPKEKTKSIMTILPMGKMKLPSSSMHGDVEYQNKKVKVSFVHREGKRVLKLSMKDFDQGDLNVSFELSEEPKDSMVIATPFAEKKKAFYYNQKMIGMRAEGKVEYQGKYYIFSKENSFGLLDWGRGIWTYNNVWYWSALQGIVNDKVFGFNFGYGFGDTSDATENMLFYDGIGHKLDKVSFHIPKDKKGRLQYLEPWVISSSDQRCNLTFQPILDRKACITAGFIKSDQHQVFGTFDGEVVLEDSTRLTISSMVGFAERVHNKW